MNVRFLAAGIVSVALGLSACGTGSGAASGGGGAPKVTIQSPAEGASVGSPVTLKFSTSVPIGPVDSGKDHVHVVIDGKSDEYTVVTSTVYQIRNLAPGRHLIGVTLQHADHSPAGAGSQVHVDVTSGGTGGGSGGGTGGDGGYVY